MSHDPKDVVPRHLTKKIYYARLKDHQSLEHKHKNEKSLAIKQSTNRLATPRSLDS